jgi:hypothetical protein
VRHFGVVACVILLALATAAAEGRDDKGGIFAPLEEGQRVVLKEAGDRYQITVVPGLEAGHKVVEVGPDYIVLVDAAGVNEIRIPIYSVKSVTVTRLPRK